MSQKNKDLAARLLLSLGFVYGLLALRYFLEDGNAHTNPFLQSLVLGWGFAVSGVVAALLPARPRPPHLEAW